MQTGESAVASAPRKASKSRLETDWRILLLVAGFSILPNIHRFLDPLETMDEGLLLVYPEQILSGRWPHLDFFTVYGPGGFGALAAAYWLAGSSVLVERAVGLVYHLAIALGLVRLTSPYGPTASAAAGIVSALMLMPLGLGAYAWLGGLAFVVWSLALLLVPARRGHFAIFAGLLGGLAVAWRLEMVVLLLAAWPVVYGAPRLGRQYLVGIAVPLVPLVALTLLSGLSLLDNIVVSRLALNAQLSLAAVPVGTWLSLVLLIGATGLLIIKARPRSSMRPIALMHAGLAILLLPQALQRIDIVHVLYSLCVTLPLAVAVLLSAPAKDQSQAVRQGARLPQGAMMGSLAALGALGAASVFAAFDPSATVVAHQGRSIFVDPTMADVVDRRLNSISATIPRGSRIFVGSTDMSEPTLTHIELYHILPEYESHAYYLELPPGVAERSGSPLVNDILTSDWLILSDTPAWLSRALFPHMGGRESSEANEAVSRNFCQVPGDFAGLTVLKACGSAPHGTSTPAADDE